MPSFLFIISGPSGVGKTSLVQAVLHDFPDIQLSVSCTTRSPRKSEVHGKDYFFLSQEEFKIKIHDQEFLEWTQVYNHYYGTTVTFIENCLKENKSIILNIDVQGAQKLKQFFPLHCVTIFIAPPNLKELRERLIRRGTETKEILEQRLKDAKSEIEASSHFNFVIINDTFLTASEQLKNIIAQKYKK
jgi:guanylate kinase